MYGGLRKQFSYQCIVHVQRCLYLLVRHLTVFWSKAPNTKNISAWPRAWERIAVSLANLPLVHGNVLD